MTQDLLGREDDVAEMESIVSWNVKLYLTAKGESQTSLASALGIQRSAMSKKISGSVAWSLADLVKAADFFGIKPAALMDDGLRSQFAQQKMESKMDSMAGAPRRTRTDNPRLKRTLL